MWARWKSCLTQKLHSSFCMFPCHVAKMWDHFVLDGWYQIWPQGCLVCNSLQSAWLPTRLPLHFLHLPTHSRHDNLLKNKNYNEYYLWSNTNVRFTNLGKTDGKQETFLTYVLINHTELFLKTFDRSDDKQEVSLCWLKNVPCFIKVFTSVCHATSTAESLTKRAGCHINKGLSMLKWKQTLYYCRNKNDYSFYCLTYRHRMTFQLRVNLPQCHQLFFSEKTSLNPDRVQNRSCMSL